MSNIIIFDWDDTLFPTTWMLSSKVNPMRGNGSNTLLLDGINTNLMNDLDDIVYSILKNSLKYGQVIIVTNAMPEWVHMSSNSLPKTKKIISKHIQIISARNKYQHKFPEDPYKWKEMTFANIINSTNSNNIISFGDADYEYKALLNLTKIKNPYKCCLKSIKLMNVPNNATLIDQLKVINKSINKIIMHGGHLELSFKTLS